MNKGNVDLDCAFVFVEEKVHKMQVLIQEVVLVLPMRMALIAPRKFKLFRPILA